MCMLIAACVSANSSQSHTLYNLPILRHSLTKILHLHPNKIVFTSISGQRAICQSHYLHVESSTLGSNLAAKYWPAFTKYIQKIYQQTCVFV